MQSEESILVTCPECSGPLREVRMDTIREYRCLVGHAYSAKFLLAAHDQAQERALWAAAAILEEAQTLARRMSDGLSAAARARIEEDAAEKLRTAVEIHRIIGRLRRFRFQDDVPEPDSRDPNRNVETGDVE